MKSAESTKSQQVTKNATTAKSKKVEESKGKGKKSAEPQIMTDTWKCEICKEESVDDNTSMLECEVCECHYCHLCLKLSDEEYKFLTKRADLHWFCPSCESNTLLSIKTDKEISARCSDYFRVVQDKLATIEKDLNLKANQQQVDMLEVIVAGKADSAKVDQLEERVHVIERKLETTTNNMSDSKAEAEQSDMVSLSLNELKDRESRKDNLIFFNIEEDHSEDVDNRKQHDIEQVCRLIDTELQVKSIVTNPVRLGKHQTSSQHPRPLRVTVDNEQTKWKILKSAKNLKESRKEEYRQIYMKRDMTLMERAQEEELRKQLKQKRKEAEEKGEQCSWIIRRGKLVNQQRNEINRK